MGGWVAGLSAAVALGRPGIEAEVFERWVRPGPLIARALFRPILRFEHPGSAKAPSAAGGVV